jgi:hypothetical protein
MDILNKSLRTFIKISRWILLKIRNVSDKSCTENQNTHFMSNNFFRKSCRLWHNVKKYKVVQIWPGQSVTCLHTNRPGHIWTTLYDRAGQAADNNIIRRMRFACWTTTGYRHILRICNTYRFYTATAVIRTRFNVTSDIYCLSFCYGRQEVIVSRNSWRDTAKIVRNTAVNIWKSHWISLDGRI